MIILISTFLFFSIFIVTITTFTGIFFHHLLRYVHPSCKKCASSLPSFAWQLAPSFFIIIFIHWFHSHHLAHHHCHHYQKKHTQKNNKNENIKTVTKHKQQTIQTTKTTKHAKTENSKNDKCEKQRRKHRDASTIFLRKSKIRIFEHSARPKKYDFLSKKLGNENSKK